MSENRVKIFNEFSEERTRQHEKFGEQNIPSVTPGLSPKELAERYEIPTEERAKKTYKHYEDKGEQTYADIVIEELAEVIYAPNEKLRREELVQLGACIVQWIESIDRNNK